MAVRFMPASPDPEENTSGRENVAEIIDIRSKLLKNASTNEIPEEAEPTRNTEPPALDAKKLAVKKLARKAMSAGELRKELLQAGCSVEETEDIITEFQESLYLDDTGLARILSEKLRNTKNASKSQIRLELQKRLIESDSIEEVLDAFDDDEEERILIETARDRARRLSDLPDHVAKRRLIAYLARRGWAGGSVYKVVNKVLAESD